MNTYGYNADTKLCQIYHRDPANAVAFETTKLDFYESNRLANAVDAIWRQAYEQGAADFAEKIRRALPTCPNAGEHRRA